MSSWLCPGKGLDQKLTRQNVVGVLGCCSSVLLGLVKLEHSESYVCFEAGLVTGGDEVVFA